MAIMGCKAGKAHSAAPSLVRPDAQSPVWLRRMRKRGGVEVPRNVRGMLAAAAAAVPVLPEEQYALPETVGRLFDYTRSCPMTRCRSLTLGAGSQKATCSARGWFQFGRPGPQ